MVKNKIVNGVKFSENTSPQVIQAVQKCMDMAIRVKIDFGDPKNGEPFNQAFESFGYIKAKADDDAAYPILVNDRKSMDGEPLNDGHIIKIEGSNSSEGGLIYQHPNYHKKHKKTSKRGEDNFRVYHT